MKPGAFVSLVRCGEKGMSRALPFGATKVIPQDGINACVSSSISVSHTGLARLMTRAVFPLQASPQTLSRGKISFSMTMCGVFPLDKKKEVPAPAGPAPIIITEVWSFCTHMM